jgi:predicted kinase
MKPKCIIFDIDGTLANLNHRRHFVANKNKDWNSFFAGINEDKPIEQTLAIFKQFQSWEDGETPYKILIVSGRPDNYQDETTNWLNSYFCWVGEKFSDAKLYMRKAGDYRPDYIIKEEILKEIQKEYEVFFVVDDRQSVVDMWRKNGLICYQINPEIEEENKKVVWPNWVDKDHPPLIVCIGPSGAGKTSYIRNSNTYAKSMHSPDTYTIFSSDDIRQKICGDFQDQSQNNRVFDIMFDLAKSTLDKGLPVILDATFLRRADRVRAVQLVSSEIPILYRVIYRPLQERVKTGGWRNDVITKSGETLHEYHESLFQNNLKYIKNGDGFKNVTVTGIPQTLQKDIK